MFNNETERGTPFCPMMGELCVDGWTKKMGESAEGKRPKCAAWRGLPLTDTVKAETKTVHGCAVYEWPPFLGYELSGLMAQTRASVDKVASETQKVAAVAAGGEVIVRPDYVQEMLAGGTVVLPVRPNPLQLEGKG